MEKQIINKIKSLEIIKNSEIEMLEYIEIQKMILGYYQILNSLQPQK